MSVLIGYLFCEYVSGIGQSRNDSIPVNVARKDGIRIRYHDSHLKFLLQAIKYELINFIFLAKSNRFKSML